MTIEIPLSKQGKNAGKYVAIVDDIDADLAELRWKASVSRIFVYATRDNRDFGVPVNESMHRVIFEEMIERKLLEDEVVEHINGDGLDNRRENLRLAIQAKNISQYEGITWDKPTKQWKARIKKGSKTVYLSYFATEREAHEAYLEASQRLFGEFANRG